MGIRELFTKHAYVLSRKATSNILKGRELPKELAREFEQAQLEMWESNAEGHIDTMRVVGDMNVHLKVDIIS